MTAAAPFKGLQPFDDAPDDVRFFFGREHEREIIASNLMASRLTVLYGETGVGKSSVLRAGVAHHLRALVRRNREERGTPELAVVVFDSWRDDPVEGLADAVATAVREALDDPSATVPAGGPLADRLQAWSGLLDGDLYLVLDGVEELFLYHDGERGPGTFESELPEAVRRSGLRASFVISLREDALGKLDRFKASIPNLFGNYLRLEHLDRDAGRRAILGPLERWNEDGEGHVEIEPELVEAVLDEVQAGKVEIGQVGRGAVEREVSERRIEAPFLQLVMRRLWDEERSVGSSVLRLETLRSLGGAEQIVRDHLDRALAELTAVDRDIAAGVFNHLVTPSGTKIAHEPADLARYAGVSEAALEPVLSALTRERVLRPTAAGNGNPRFEIYHDVLGESVLAWRAEHERARELEEGRAEATRRHRRLLGVIAAGSVLLAVMTAVTAFALVQRGDAQRHAREADARQLSTAAVSMLGQDPQLSLLLAREAARLDPGSETEAILRQSLVSARERAVLPAAGPVTVATTSRDGGRILTASEDGTVRVYDAVTRKLTLRIDHGAPVLDAEFSRNGLRILSAGEDGVARLWRAADGSVVRAFEHQAPVRSASLDRTDTMLVTAGGRSARLWRVDGTLVRELRWRHPVLGAAFATDGTSVAVFGRDRLVRLYSATTGALLRTFDQGGLVTSIAFGRGRRLLVTTGANETARIWKTSTGTLLHELRGHTASVLAAAFSPRTRLVATASADGTARVWEVGIGRLVATISGHTNLVTAVAFSPDGNFVATASSDRTARVSKADTGDLRALLAGHRDSVGGVVFSPNGLVVLTAGDDDTARIWDPWTQPQLEPIARLGGAVAEGEFVSPGAAVLTAGPGRKAVLLRADSGRVERTFLLRSPVRAVAASADGALVAVAAGRRVDVFERRGAHRYAVVSPATVTSVAFGADGTIVTGDERGLARIWGTDGRLLRTIRAGSEPIADVAVSPGGDRLALASGDASVRIVAAGSGRLERTLTGHRDAVTSVAFSPDGRLVLTASRDHDARLWDAETGTSVQVLRWHFGRVSDASFSPDGRWIVTAGPVTVGLWQPGTREPVLPYGFGGNTALLTSASFDPTGREILSTAEDGTVRLARCEICGGRDELLALADAQLRRVRRPLTAEERNRYGL